MNIGTTGLPDHERVLGGWCEAVFDLLQLIAVALLLDHHIDAIYFRREPCRPRAVVKVIITLLGYDHPVAIATETAKIRLVVEALLCDEELISLPGIGKVDIVETASLLEVQAFFRNLLLLDKNVVVVALLQYAKPFGKPQLIQIEAIVEKGLRGGGIYGLTVAGYPG